MTIAIKCLNTVVAGGEYHRPGSVVHIDAAGISEAEARVLVSGGFAMWSDAPAAPAAPIEASQVADTEPKVYLDAMKKAELVEMANAAGIEGAAKLNKDELIAALRGR